MFRLLVRGTHRRWDGGGEHVPAKGQELGVPSGGVGVASAPGRYGVCREGETVACSCPPMGTKCGWQQYLFPTGMRNLKHLRQDWAVGRGAVYTSNLVHSTERCSGNLLLFCKNWEKKEKNPAYYNV